ncbi:MULTISPECIES: hypothetical protein [unclassified Sphingomonas]|nr:MULTISPECIES: hypothetical protein [unclassified Sphingomonas]KRB91257.1 hypothetical protein ASE22_13560 [Sphingomonas sp. Root720]
MLIAGSLLPFVAPHGSRWSTIAAVADDYRVAWPANHRKLATDPGFLPVGIELNTGYHAPSRAPHGTSSVAQRHRNRRAAR